MLVCDSVYSCDGVCDLSLCWCVCVTCHCASVAVDGVCAGAAVMVAVCWPYLLQ